MGCDIHLFAEEKWPGSSRWHPVYYEELKIWRDYSVFAQLADVRNHYDTHYEPIAQPRGIPVDANPDTREMLENGSYHSHSWVTFEEFKKRWPKESMMDSQFARTIWALHYDFGPEVRLVFAFDN